MILPFQWYLTQVQAAPQQENLLERTVSTHLGIFLTPTNRRDESEGVFLKDGTLEIWFLDGFKKGQINEKICHAARWVSVGRLKASLGAKQLFKIAPKVRTLKLIIYDVMTKVDPDLDGRYVQTRTAKPLVTIMLSKEQIAS